MIARCGGKRGKILHFPALKKSKGERMANPSDKTPALFTQKKKKKERKWQS